MGHYDEQREEELDKRINRMSIEEITKRASEIDDSVCVVTFTPKDSKDWILHQLKSVREYEFLDLSNTIEEER